MNNRAGPVGEISLEGSCFPPESPRDHSEDRRMLNHKLSCVVLGSGNIGTDLMAKLLRSDCLYVTAVVGIDPSSEGLTRARTAGLETSADGVDWIVNNVGPSALVFEATSAQAHRENAPKLYQAGIQTIDLTPAKLG